MRGRRPAAPAWTEGHHGDPGLALLALPAVLALGVALYVSARRRARRSREG